MLQQVLLDPRRIGGREIHLVDGDDDRLACALSVADGLLRLRHHAIVSRNHQDNHIGYIGPARAHRGERSVAGRIEESDASTVIQVQVIGTDVLGDPSGFANDHVGLPYVIEQRCLPVVDVSHHGDHRGPRNEPRLIDLPFGLNELGAVLILAHRLEPEFLCDQLDLIEI